MRQTSLTAMQKERPSVDKFSLSLALSNLNAIAEPAASIDQ